MEQSKCFSPMPLSENDRKGVVVLVKTYGFYLLAAFGEIAGCFAFWAWLRLDKSPVYAVLPWHVHRWSVLSAYF
jgi:hypothetical protein